MKIEVPMQKTTFGSLKIGDRFRTSLQIPKVWLKTTKTMGRPAGSRLAVSFTEQEEVYTDRDR
jgi:hypothetical protein